MAYRFDPFCQVLSCPVGLVLSCRGLRGLSCPVGKKVEEFKPTKSVRKGNNREDFRLAEEQKLQLEDDPRFGTPADTWNGRERDFRLE